LNPIYNVPMLGTQDASSNGGQRVSLNSGFIPRRG
jgi:hypothetical protein